MIEWELVVALVAILMGGLIFIIPLGALALRFASKPVIEALIHYKQMNEAPTEHVKLLRERMELLEQRIEGMESSLQRLESGKEFDRKLAAGEPGSPAT